MSVAPLAAPVVKARPGTDKISLDWNAVPGATSTTIVASTTAGGAPFFTATVGGLTVTQFNLSSGTTYYYRVTASNAKGSSAPTSLSAATLLPAPLNLTARAQSGSALVLLGWSAVPGASRYQVKRATTAGGPYQNIAQSSGTSASDAGAAIGTRYFYRVSALTSVGGEGLDSGEVSFVVPPVAAPTLVTHGENGRVRLDWNSVEGASGYRISRSAARNGAYAPLQNSANLSALDGGLTNGTTYYYRVRAFNDGGDGPDSAAIEGMPVPPPAAPLGLSARVKDRGVDLSWQPVTWASGYGVQMATAPGGTWTFLNGPTAINSYNVAGLTNGKTYYFRVQAYNSAGDGPLSATVSATPLAPPGAAPTNLRAVAGNAQITLTWTAVAGATSYRVDVGTTANAVTSNLSAAGSPWVQSGLTNGQTYYYRVTAVNDAGTGPASMQVSATPIAPPPPTLTRLDASVRAQSSEPWLGENIVNDDALGQTRSNDIYAGQSASNEVQISGSGGSQSTTVVLSLPDWAQFAAFRLERALLRRADWCERRRHRRDRADYERQRLGHRDEPRRGAPPAHRGRRARRGASGRAAGAVGARPRQRHQRNARPRPRENDLENQVLRTAGLVDSPARIRLLDGRGRIELNRRWTNFDARHQSAKHRGLRGRPEKRRGARGDFRA